MDICPSCGSELALGAKFCIKCGFEVPVQASVSSASSELKVVTRFKRPHGLTFLGLFWLGWGLWNLFSSGSTAGTYSGLESNLTSPSFVINPQYVSAAPWLQQNILILEFISVIGIFIAVAQIVNAFGFWNGKSFVFRGALLTQTILFVMNLLWLYIEINAPSVLGLSPSALDFGTVIWSGIWIVILWNYLGKANVRAFLGVDKYDDAGLGERSYPVQDQDQQPWYRKSKSS